MIVPTVGGLTLVVQNTIHVPSMENNLIPPFMMREAGIMVNEKAKIHTDDLKDSDHSITFSSTGFRISLYLWGIFSYFSTRQPTREDLLAGHDVYVLSPSKWDPHSEAYGQNEANMTDWEGNVKEPKDRPYQVVIDEIDAEIDASEFAVSSTEANIFVMTTIQWLMIGKMNKFQDHVMTLIYILEGCHLFSLTHGWHSKLRERWIWDVTRLPLVLLLG